MKHDEICRCNKCKLKALRSNLARLIMRQDCTDAINEVLAEISEVESELLNAKKKDGIWK